MSKTRLRNLWFDVHKWIGLLLAVLIIPLSLTGSALVWHDWLDARVNPERYAVSGAATLPASRYVEAARAVLAPGEQVVSLRYPEHGDGPVMVSAAPAKAGTAAGPPRRTNVYLDGATARVLDKAGSREGLVQVLHVLHGSLMVPGMGRQIVGWIGVAMLVSSLTGLWLWWPLTGSFARGFRWKRRPQFDANLHHQLGFWICIPLAMLSFTGAWISFPAFFGPMVGEKPPQRPAPAPALAQPVQQVDTVVAKAGGQPVSIAWPTGKSPVWKIGLERGEAEVADATGAVAIKPPKPETIARTMRRWHDGTGMGPLWQVVIFLGGIIPAVLSITGITMWVNSRKWRKRPTRRVAPAE
ncbi:PepSY domain-containing protein [Sphingomonas sp. ID1715]|uniref:PepSY-associated TM helix domain-containing protein n=1 Tax=Sphingomonas sp. ID1715 TaxID=1656898 RepID=UPI0014888A4B|nr:PepSY-associated TM helix domain-containing protein [Sphingomonas sp. ID1715]NNM77882.1 PepSY domain-containing protein [Sphingomonas sp. ID1715]